MIHMRIYNDAEIRHTRFQEQPLTAQILRCAAGDTPEKHQLSSEEFQDKKTDLYRNAVMHFNEMRKQSGAIS